MDDGAVLPTTAITTDPSDPSTTNSRISWSNEPDPDYRRRLLIGCLISMVALSGLFMCARFFSQWRFRKLQGWDGPVLLFSWVCPLSSSPTPHGACH